MKYVLIRMHETASIGGYDVNHGILISSALKGEVEQKLKNIVEIAIEDKNVEFINGVERDKFNLLPDFYVESEVVVEYYTNGMVLFDRAIYSIVIEDEEA